MTFQKFSLNGKSINLSLECKKKGLDYPVVYERIKSGWSVEKALSTPVRKKGAFVYEGKKYTLERLCLKFGFDLSYISNQLYLQNCSLEEAISKYKSRGEFKKREYPKFRKSRRVLNKNSDKIISDLSELYKRHTAIKRKFKNKLKALELKYALEVEYLEYVFFRDFQEVLRGVELLSQQVKNQDSSGEQDVTFKPLISEKKFQDFLIRCSELKMKNVKKMLSTHDQGSSLLQ